MNRRRTGQISIWLILIYHLNIPIHIDIFKRVRFMDRREKLNTCFARRSSCAKLDGYQFQNTLFRPPQAGRLGLLGHADQPFVLLQGEPGLAPRGIPWRAGFRSSLGRHLRVACDRPRPREIPLAKTPVLATRGEEVFKGWTGRRGSQRPRRNLAREAIILRGPRSFNQR